MPNEQLCHGEYHADRANGFLVVTARGTHMTSGYTVELQTINHRPLMMRLLHVPPNGPVADVLTPFAVSASVRDQVSPQVRIFDAVGTHEVPVTEHRAGSNGASRSALFSADAFDPVIACRACVRGVIESWSGSTIFDWATKLKDLYLPNHGQCDETAITDLTDQLATAGCGKTVNRGAFTCDSTAADVRDAIC